MHTILLGPQRFTVRATAALHSIGVDGPIGVINSGWEEREDVTDELHAALDHRAVNLRLYHRFLDVLDKDHGFASAALRMRDGVDELTALYRLRLEHTLDGVYAVQRRVPTHPSRARTSLAYEALLDAVGGVRRIDAWFLDRMARLRADLADAGGVATSGVIGWHRGEVRATLENVAALVLPGGNVSTLMRTLRLFDVVIPASTPVIAWSAGAMALTERIALFYDYGPEGSREAELLDRGLGRLPEVVLFPHARRRLQLEDRARSEVLALRFGDERCVLLDDGAWIEMDDGGALPDGARVLGTDGLVSGGGGAR